MLKAVGAAPDVERRLYMARRRTEKRLSSDPEFYIACLSSFVHIYKGLVMPRDLPNFITIWLIRI